MCGLSTARVKLSLLFLLLQQLSPCLSLSLAFISTLPSPLFASVVVVAAAATSDKVRGGMERNVHPTNSSEESKTKTRKKDVRSTSIPQRMATLQAWTQCRAKDFTVK
ncbi:unnamed protein product [Hydatigera taeniaeformis]|uniref:Secreted protein n=1 Tax=Hydatigena taeniaeformis TaxID=6205 RepID=A0A0R3WW81_HYDTA|nr:unnamed protein product [Hydatigera taeniaeformis]